VLVYSGAYIALIAALEVVLVMVVLGLSTWLAPVAVGCITFTIYANDRLVDVESDAVSNPTRTAFVQRHRRSLSALAATAYGVAVMLAVDNGPLALALALFPAAVWVLYAVDWVPGLLGSIRRLKDVLMVSSLLVGLAWAVTVVVMPIAFAGVGFSPASWILIGYFAIGTFIGTEISNVRDIEADETNSAATLPTTVGVKATKYILHGVAITGLALLYAGWASDELRALTAGALAVGLFAVMGVISLLDRDVEASTLAIGGELARLPALAILLIGLSL
jgi:4-hydroxybenzoate polyprenyltransferase